MTTGIYRLAGIATVIENLSEHLAKKGVDVTIGAIAFKRIPRIRNRAIVIPINNISRLRSFLQHFDIIHNHHPITNFLALLGPRSFVYHYHGAPNIGRGYLFRINMLLSCMLTKHTYDATIAISEYAAQELKHYFRLKNVRVIYNGVDTGRFNPNLEEKFRQGRPQFLFVGNLHTHKRVEELILALKKLINEYPNVHLQIVGAGVQYRRLRHLITKLNLYNHVSLLGRVSDEQLPYYYASCDVYVTASRWELFGLPLLEAMACGKPVVASSILPHFELVSKSRGGMLYKTGDINNLCSALIQTYREKDKYGRNAMRFARKYSWAAVAGQIMEVYQRLHKVA